MTRLQALRYIRNTGGNATKHDFIEDWEPVGVLEWPLLVEGGLVQEEINGGISLTPKGESDLARLEKANV